MSVSKSEVFLSSRFVELFDIRQAVAQAFLGNSHLEIVNLDDNKPDFLSVSEVCIERAKNSDIFILLLGETCGTNCPGTEKSYTQLEYEAALESRIGPEILVFAIGSIYDSTTFGCDNEFDRWRTSLFQKHRVSVFSKPHLDPIAISTTITKTILELALSLALRGKNSESLNPRASNGKDQKFCTTQFGFNSGRSYEAQIASTQDLKEIVDFGKNLVGDHHIDLEMLQRRHSINGQIVTKIIDRKCNDKLVGYFIVYPLLKSAYRDILEVRVLNGKQLSDRHLSKSFKTATALYIGIAGGEDGHAKGMLIEKMLSLIAPLAVNSTTKAIFAKGATVDGKRILKDFGFHPLTEPSEISMLSLSNATLANPRIQRHLLYR